MACGTCPNNNCNGGLCYTLSGDNFLQYRCLAAGQTCDVNIRTNVLLQNCRYDYLSRTCSTGLCFQAQNIPVANYNNQCIAQTNNRISCGACTTVGCNGFCSVITDSNNNQTSVCAPGCQRQGTFAYDVGLCPSGSDYLGSVSNCCTTFLTAGAPVCTSQSSVLFSQNLKQWAQFQYYATFALGSILAITLL